MGLLSISVVVASVVYVLIRPPPWMPLWFLQWRQGQLPQLDARQDTSRSITTSRPEAEDSERKTPSPSEQLRANSNERYDGAKAQTPAPNKDAKLMPPPPLPTINTTPTVVEPAEETTPKAEASVPSISVPTFSLNGDSPPSSSKAMPPPSMSMAPPSFSMPPPPRPSNTSTSSSSKPTSGRIPTLPQFPAANSAQRARGPIPARGPPGASSGLTPPPTITTKPQKPSRKVLLEPGHSPLDWASISGPNADLRGVPPETPYLKVTPSMLKEKTGRKGKDAWMAINGKVYNVTPYAKYHPGGVPELMRAAARDGTKLFYEIHPWVNYDTMLAACLVGLMVEEPEGSGPSKMDEMD